MSYILAFLLSSLLIYKYVLLFAVVFLGAVIIPLPINTLLLATGAFASQGYFSFTLSFIVVMVANMLGDITDYFLAKIYGERVIVKLRIKIPPYFKKLESYVREHAGLTIFITRFLGTMDSLAALLAGLVGVSFSRFVLFDFLGNLAANFPVLYAGYAVGNYWTQLSGIISTIGWIFLALSLIYVIVIMSGGKFGIKIWSRTHNHEE